MTSGLDPYNVAGSYELSPCVSAKSLESWSRNGGGRIVHISYIVDPLGSNSMKSANPKSGFHREQRSMTLDTTTPCPQKGQGGLIIVEVTK